MILPVVFCTAIYRATHPLLVVQNVEATHSAFFFLSLLTSVIGLELQFNVIYVNSHTPRNVENMLNRYRYICHVITAIPSSVFSQ